MTQTYTFPIQGLHCASCVVLTESALREISGVVSAKTSLKHQFVEVTGDFGERTEEEVLRDLNAVLNPHGYSLVTSVQEKSNNWLELGTALLVAIAFVALFLALQRLGLVRLVNTATIGYGTVFLIGVMASVSSCMAVVGGLVLSVSASFAKEGKSVRPQAMFHVSRLVTFFVLGGVIGVLGSVFQLGRTGSLVLGLVVAFVLFILGLNLLEVLPVAKRLQMTLPNQIGVRVQMLKTVNRSVSPLLFGFVTFFLPCGFTQSMQIYTLTTGSFWRGALTMLVFALGTFPVLALISFGTTGIKNSPQSGLFFKTAGFIVIFFAVLNLLTTLAGAGIIPPIVNF